MRRRRSRREITWRSCVSGRACGPVRPLTLMIFGNKMLVHCISATFARAKLDPRLRGKLRKSRTEGQFGAVACSARVGGGGEMQRACCTGQQLQPFGTGAGGRGRWQSASDIP